MDYKIFNNLPLSHRWKTIIIDGQRLKGIVWDEKDIERNDEIYLYKKWATVHFDSNWYELAAGSAVDDKATLRDVSIIKSILGNRLNSKVSLIDVNCGAARHLIKLAEDNIVGVGMEGALLLRKQGQKKAKINNLPLKIVSTSKYFRHIYFEHADIVTSLFNSMGYSFNKRDDIKRLKWMTALLKPKGYLLLDIRAEEYQKKHYFTPLTISEKMCLPTDSNKTPITIVTKKYWKDGILAAEENIRLGTKNIVTAQNTTYGWRTYSLVDLKSMLGGLGLRLIGKKLDYYSNPENFGERIFLLAQKTSMT